MPCPFVHLSLEERRRLMRLREAKVRVDEIARQLVRHRSTIYREIKRNWWHDAEVPQAEGYWPTSAQMLADRRRHRRCKLLRHPRLQAAVVERLKEGWSPEQIAGRLRLERGARQRLGHETTDRFVNSKAGQGQDLARYLPKPRRGRKPRGLVFPKASRIRHRPEAVNARSAFGYWEADRMIVRKEFGPANVATVIERTSRKQALRPQRRPALEAIDGLTDRGARDPARARPAESDLRPGAGDHLVARAGERHRRQGLVLRSPSALAEGLGQEHESQGRRYLPPDTVLLALADRSMRSICERFNATPRECLGLRTPAEAFRDGLLERANRCSSLTLAPSQFE